MGRWLVSYEQSGFWFWLGPCSQEISDTLCARDGEPEACGPGTWVLLSWASPSASLCLTRLHNGVVTPALSFQLCLEDLARAGVTSVVRRQVLVESVSSLVWSDVFFSLRTNEIGRRELMVWKSSTKLCPLVSPSNMVSDILEQSQSGTRVPVSCRNPHTKEPYKIQSPHGRVS